MDHEEFEQFQRRLHQATRFPQPFEWLFERGQQWERAYVARKDLLRWGWLWMVAKFVLVLASTYGALVLHGWVNGVSQLVLLLLASLSITGHMRRAQAYRSGWMDRGSHDITEHRLVCDDPAAGEAFSMRMIQLNSEVVL